MNRLKRDDGQALISGLIMLAGVLVPLLFIVPLYARLEQGRLAAEQAARDAVRAAVESPSPTAAQTAAETAVERASTETGQPLELELDGTFARGAVLRVHVRGSVALASLPLFGSIGTVTVSGDAAAPVDQYRSLLTSTAP